VYFWARTMPCPNPQCRVDIPLLSSFWLANSKRRTVWVDVTGRPGRVDIEIRSGSPPDDYPVEAGTVRAASVTCPACRTSVGAREVRSYAKQTGFGSLLYAVLDIEERVRHYRAPTPAEVQGAIRLATAELRNLPETPDGTSPVPDEPVDPIGYINLQNLVYGYDTWGALFTPRQLYVLGVLSEAVRAAFDEMIASGIAEDRAVAIATYLGLCVDRAADYNSAFTTWAPGGEFLRSTFPRQAISMAWDFTEIDPLADVSGNWRGAVRWIDLAIRHCSTTGRATASVYRGNSQELPFPTDYFDAVIVDPPYYFSVMYSDLSDFFYVWLKRSIGHLHQGHFSTQWTPKDQEVIQNRTNPKDPRYISSDEFERRLERSLREIVRVVKDDGVVSIVFAHTDVVAWERLLRSLQKVGLVVSTSWPMRSERGGRQLAQVKAALGSSVVLVCRPQQARQEGFYDDVVRALEQRIAERLDAFEEMGLVGADYFASAIGPAFEVFALYSRIVKLSGEEVDVSELMVLARQAVARHAMRRLLGADPLAALDAESLFYLTWRWAYVTAAIPADEAYKLERAFDVDLGHFTNPGGFARRAGSNFELLGPHERKGLKLSTSPSMVDVLHLSCQLWDAGRRRELEELLGATGMGVEPGYWAMARALGEVMPDGNKERIMLLGLTGNRDALAQAAAKSTTTVEELTLFDLGVK
jgi:putative DNA methylase